MRLFLSYQTLDGGAAQRLYTALLRRRPALEIFFDRKGLVAGDVWEQRLADELAAADAILLLLGRRLGPWQEREFQEAQRLQLLAGREKRPRIIPVALSPDARLPAFAALYHHVAAPEPDADEALDGILAALDRTDTADGTPDWQRINPYKGLAALTASDAAFFFGREVETAALLEHIRDQPAKVLTLVGNSGVGKSSLIQAGVIDALRTQRWPGTGRHEPQQWIGGLADSHRWSAITFRPGETPVLALAYAFLGLAYETGVELEREATGWAALLLAGTPLDRLRNSVGDLLTRRTGQQPPRRYLIYIDQGEELYARSASEQRTRFSSLIAEAAGNPDFLILSSLRSDYYGRLQGDLVLFNASERVDLPPMSGAALARAIGEPARHLRVRFDPPDAPTRLASVAEKQSGALPLLSDLMADLWREMEQRGDGVLKERTDLVDVGRPLSLRADRYLTDHPRDKEAVRKLFTLHLAHVPTAGEAGRRRARRSECSDEQWRIVETLSDHEWRLLTVSEDAATHEPTVEVAHEQLLRSWTTLRDWLNESRGFLIWKGMLEHARQDWLEAGKADDALLLGAQLTRALYWRNEQGSELRPDELSFIEVSEQHQAREAQKERDAEADRLRLERERQEEKEANLVERARSAARFRMVTTAGFLVVSLLAMATLFLYIQAVRTENRALATQSRLMGQTAKDVLAQGDVDTALALAVEALPRDEGNTDRPYVAEAERALQEAVRYHPRQLEILRGHDSTVRSAVFSPDGTRVLTASVDTTARLWKAATGKELAVLRGHEGMVYSAVFSPDGTHVLTASVDKTARLWEAATGKELAVLRGHADVVLSAVFSPDGRRVLTASEDKTARLWEAADGKELAVMSGHDGGVTGAVFSPDGSRVLTASEDKTARLWEAADGKELAVMSGHDGGVTGAVFSPDGSRVLTASEDKTARLWEAATGKELAVMSGHEDVVNSAVFSPPDGTYVLTASWDMTARMWEAATGKELAVLRGHKGTVRSAAFSPDGRRVLTASQDKTARLWEAAIGKELAVMSGHEDKVDSAVFSRDGTRVLTASWDKTARLWEAATGKELAVLRGHDGEVYSAVFSPPDGTHVLTASEDKTARLWDAATGKELAVLRGHDGEVNSAVFSPDGRRVLTASEDKTARLWEAAIGKELAVMSGHEDKVGSAVFSPDGTRVLTASWDKTARLWEAATGKVLTVLRGHDGRVYSAVFSPDGRRVLTASLDKTARLWEAATGKELAVLCGHADVVLSAVFSPDGTHVLTASWDMTARLWEVATGKALAVLRGHEDKVFHAVFSPDGRRVLTASEDKTARLWEAATGKELTVLRGHDGRVYSAVFSPDGRRVLTASEDKTARLWENFRTTQELVDRACLILPRPLSLKQRERFFLEDTPKTWPCGWNPSETQKPPYVARAAQ